MCEPQTGARKGKEFQQPPMSVGSLCEAQTLRPGGTGQPAIPLFRRNKVTDWDPDADQAMHVREHGGILLSFCAGL